MDYTLCVTRRALEDDLGLVMSFEGWDAGDIIQDVTQTFIRRQPTDAPNDEAPRRASARPPRLRPAVQVRGTAPSPGYESGANPESFAASRGHLEHPCQPRPWGLGVSCHSTASLIVFVCRQHFHEHHT